MRIWARILRFSRERRPVADHTGVAYELAYEARVAVDALRFAIKQLEGELSPGDRQQTAFVLLDAFDCLVRAEHHFRSLRSSNGPRGGFASFASSARGSDMSVAMNCNSGRNCSSCAAPSPLALAVGAGFRD